MSKTAVKLISVFFLMFALSTQALQLKDNAPDRYIVKKGDTLWKIAEKYTSDPWQWPNIWHQNPQVSNPHLIFPGDEIGLVTVNGKTVLTVVKRGQQSRTVKLTPSTRIEPIESAIDAIPMSTVAPFIRRNRIVESNAFKQAPYIISADRAHLLMGAGSRAYARGQFEGNAATAYGIYRQGKKYHDPQTGEFLGLEAIEVGVARVVGQEDDIVVLDLVSTNQQVREGDRLLLSEDRTVTTRFFPKAPDAAVQGTILSVPGGVSQIGQYDMIAINRGQRDGVTEGAILNIMKRPRAIRDRVANKKILLPAEFSGVLMVVRSFEKMSYGLVMKASDPLAVGDTVEAPGFN